MDITDYACELSNYCIFQGVNDIFRCDDIGSPCSNDAIYARMDGTFICNYHLGKYFKILKSSFTIPSGKDNRKSFKMLVGQSLLDQNLINRILIPVDHETHLRTSARSAMEKFIIYTIYNDKRSIEELCKLIVQQEYYEEPLWIRNEHTISTIMGLINPSMLCERVVATTDTRSFNAQDSYELFNDKPFLKNLINRLVRPILFTFNGGISIKVENSDTCTFNSNGLVVPALHNPNVPVRPENPRLQPKFNIRTVVEFEGRATQEQRALSMYEEVVLSRPLLNGTQVFTMT
ncbi:vp39 [Psilogramma increta granulovirus]|uniref:Vp39 n=1 Tax=Psilogramma increta granulovirus TaxID=2953508 RepID=A0A977TP20_9BBAC|nr:vp39 [Psilogramma increta granulovirus]